MNSMHSLAAGLVGLWLAGVAPTDAEVVDTGQNECYDDAGVQIQCPLPGEPFHGQDAQHSGAQPAYVDHGDGTVSDLVTGLMWQQAPTVGLTHAEAVTGASSVSTGGHTDWRLPSIQELYSLIDFTGVTGMSEAGSTPYIDTEHFGFLYGDTASGERFIDAQYVSETEYVGTTMGGNPTVFGVNFADGRIKGYPIEDPHGQQKTFHVRYVRGPRACCESDLVDSSDGTVTDLATGLMWSRTDSGEGMAWVDALAWVEQLNNESFQGHDDWRLPNAKELQSLVDYTRAPDITGSAAIDPMLEVTAIVNEGGVTDYPYFWTSTTHLDGPEDRQGNAAVYVAFGRALGWMEQGTGSGIWQLLDVHGAGAQRSDPKGGDPAAFPRGRGPQGDVIRILNFVRPVRDAGEGGSGDPPDDPPPADQRTVGTLVNAPGTSAGLTLFAPQGSDTTFLVDLAGNLVHSWVSTYTPGQAVYLLPDGHLLRTENPAPGPSAAFSAGGAGGRVVELDWDGSRLWELDVLDDERRTHHDVERLPNGNILLIAWERKTSAEAIAAGRDPALLADGELWPDHLIEVAPTGSAGGTVVWEWHVWDHLVQDHDPSKPAYGVVSEHPERIDINYTSGRPGADWNHTNAVDYNPELDQILLSVRGFSEIWIIDHSTSTEEAAGGEGGRWGRGGDLLYRWGNPQAWQAGDTTDQQLFVQHDAQWIEEGLPGAGNILVFNNGQGRSGADYSSVDEIAPPTDDTGAYLRSDGEPFGPGAPVWSYTAPVPTDLYASHISGAQRLSNGNTLICDGPYGTFLEVTDSDEVVWTYVNPVTRNGVVTQGEEVPSTDSGLANTVFRATRHGFDSPAFDGCDLTPGNPIEPYASPPVAEFSLETCPVAGEPIQLVDCSTGFPAVWEWDLGDGTTSSAPDPMHVWTAAGSYAVTLTVLNPAGQDSVTATVEVANARVRTGGRRVGPAP